MLLNDSHKQHMLIALGIQLLAGLLTGEWLMSSVLGGAIFFVREQTQAERRLKDKGMPAAQAVPESFKFWKWNEDSILDAACPIIAMQWAWPLIL